MLFKHIRKCIEFLPVLDTVLSVFQVSPHVILTTALRHMCCYYHVIQMREGSLEKLKIYSQYI